MRSPSLLSAKKLMDLFRGFIEEVEELLGIKVKGVLPQIRYLDSPLDFERPDLGVVSGEKEVAIPAGEAFLVRSMLAVEAFRRLLPASISDLPQALDLAWAFAYSQLGKAERKKWKDIWRKVAQTIDLGDIVHYPVEAFALLVEMSPRRGLAELVDIFAELDRYHGKVGTKEFVRLVEDFFTYYQVKLSEREVRVLDAVTWDPDFNLEELSERINLTPRMVSATVASLKRRGILFLKESVDFLRLGFTVKYLYLIPRRTAEEEVVETLRRYPYLYSLGEFTDGQGGFIATLFIPYWLEADEEIEKLKGLLKPICQPERCFCFERVRGYSHRSFRHYSLRESDWRIPWQSWSLWLKRILTHPGLSSVIEFLSKTGSEKREKPVTLDKLDWAIIKEVFEGETRVRQLRQKLGIGSNLLQQRMQRLREEEVITTRVGALCIGLSEPVFLLIEGEPKELWSLLAAFDELPYHFTVEIEGDVKGLFSILFFPRGQGPAFAYQIHKHIQNNHIQLHIGLRIPWSYMASPTPPETREVS